MNDTDILCHGVVCILGVQECLFILMPKPIDKVPIGYIILVKILLFSPGYQNKPHYDSYSKYDKDGADPGIFQKKYQKP